MLVKIWFWLSIVITLSAIAMWKYSLGTAESYAEVHNKLLYTASLYMAFAGAISSAPAGICFALQEGWEIFSSQKKKGPH